MDDAVISTMDALRCLGFQPDPKAIYYETSGLSLDFGILRIDASPCVNRLFAEIVLVSGILHTPRSLAEIHIELPRRVKSLKQCAAWIVWHLDQHSEFRNSELARHFTWIEEGRQNQKLLPWVKDMAEYNARPKCTVRRDWLRLALKTLAEHLVSLPDDAVIVFAFDGSVLSIRCDKKVVVLAGEGLPWTVQFKVTASALRRLPKRLMSEKIGVSFWESRIQLGFWSYEGRVELLGGADHSSVQ